VHEASLMRNLMGQILALARERRAARVVGLTVRLGALSHLSPEHFRAHFEEAARGTIAEGALLETIVETDIRAACAADVLLEAIEIE
jgi:hydrogenase nickel incorporation protein HypA/HybF